MKQQNTSGRKRWISLFLCISVIFSSLATTVFAAYNAGAALLAVNGDTIIEADYFEFICQTAKEGGTRPGTRISPPPARPPLGRVSLQGIWSRTSPKR